MVMMNGVGLEKKASANHTSILLRAAPFMKLRCICCVASSLAPAEPGSPSETWRKAREKHRFRVGRVNIVF